MNIIISEFQVISKIIFPSLITPLTLFSNELVRLKTLSRYSKIYLFYKDSVEMKKDDKLYNIEIENGLSIEEKGQK